ncbi:MAG: hypothetical protein AB1485_08630, partial [Candidatus Thermoplasmatota archaeon]
MKKRLFVGFGFAIVVLAASIGTFVLLEKSNIETKSFTTLQSHEPIYIHGNDEFVKMNGIIAGSGVKDDPYIIEGWKIKVEGDHGNGILIMDTSAWLILRNCHVIGYGYLSSEARERWSRGIHLHNVTNCT